MLLILGFLLTTYAYGLILICAYGWLANDFKLPRAVLKAALIWPWLLVTLAWGSAE